ncbi:hypothetical protein C9374_009017 [Naegleria lovaniensis]|uniref:Uncharacterized protein n=1 Tax=Naegleria lovaniensis TaxID=51637 RepID=A0AA88GEE1_NAELO|nr:uncharacterized protein C9374_009017 [Naegleria lovaniensis]KAG2377932.1 hypothetical protein C9374_009017 [Naegleria lovaniensis]
MSNLLTIPCQYIFQGKSADMKLSFKSDSERKRTMEILLPRYGMIPIELSEVIDHKFTKINSEGMLLLRVQMNIISLSNENNEFTTIPPSSSSTTNQSLKPLVNYLYNLMQNKTKGHVVKNALERISKIVNQPIFTGDQVEFDLIVTVSGNWETYSKKFLDIIGSFSKVENKPVLYSIGREFFFDKRDATASLNGYLYQVDLTVNYWLDTLDEEHSDKCVMTEFGEDIAVLPVQFVLDIERFSGNGSIPASSKTDSTPTIPLLIFEQAKLYKKPIPFNSDSICDILFNYYTTMSRAARIPANIVYRLTTSTQVEGLEKWKACNNDSSEMLKQLITLQDEKRKNNKAKARYMREKQEWENFKNFCEQDWSTATAFLSRVEFIENMTCEKVSQEIERKLSKHYVCRNFKTLSNCLYGFVKSQLLEQSTANGKLSRSMMLDQHKLKQVIDSIVTDFASLSMR